MTLCFLLGRLGAVLDNVRYPSSGRGRVAFGQMFSLFGCADMQLPFLPFIAATDVSTEYGHGGIISRVDVEEICKVARIACKAGGHVCMRDGAELGPELLAGLGPRHHLKLELRNFDVIVQLRLIHLIISILKRALLYSDI